MRKAKLITPVDTGALRASGHVRPPVISPNNVSVELGYGGPAAPYAALVHENPRRVTFKTGQDHYLQIPFLEERPRIERRLGVKLKARIQRLTKTGKLKFAKL